MYRGVQKSETKFKMSLEVKESVRSQRAALSGIK